MAKEEDSKDDGQSEDDADDESGKAEPGKLKNLTDTAKAFAALGSLTYLIGILVVTFDLRRYGISALGALRARYIFVGATFAVMFLFPYAVVWIKQSIVGRLGKPRPERRPVTPLRPSELPAAPVAKLPAAPVNKPPIRSFDAANKMLEAANAFKFTTVKLGNVPIGNVPILPVKSPVSSPPPVTEKLPGSGSFADFSKLPAPGEPSPGLQDLPKGLAPPWAFPLTAAKLGGTAPLLTGVKGAPPIYPAFGLPQPKPPLLAV